MTSSNYSEKTLENAVQKLLKNYGLELCLIICSCCKSRWNMWMLRARSLDKTQHYGIRIEHEDGKVTSWVKDYGEGKWHSIAHALAKCRRCILIHILDGREEIDIKMPHSIDEMVVLGDLA